MKIKEHEIARLEEKKQRIKRKLMDVDKLAIILKGVK